ncbi:MAG: cytochrome oxidase Cu insertion factor (SCO1/SenC/PrrC family) [bacterium]|jgi:cytochrome oxidase Cu insertion factor (SCO1/SenC/PrrC family)
MEEYKDLKQKHKKLFFGILLIASVIGWFFVMPLIPLNANRSIKSTFLKPEKGNFAFVFFGYPGCSTTCPTTLKILERIYLKAQKKIGINKVQVNFVNLLPNVPEKDVNQYVKRFHPDFIGITLAKEKLAQALTDFGVIFSKDVKKTMDLTHSGYTFLLEKKSSKWIIRYIYPEGYLLENRVLQNLNSLVQ